MLNAEMSWTPQEVGGSHVQPNILLQYLHDLPSHWHIWGAPALTLTGPPLLKAESHLISLSQRLCSHPSFPSPGTLLWAYKTCSNIYHVKTTLDPTSFLTINSFLCSIRGKLVHAGLSISFFPSFLQPFLVWFLNFALHRDPVNIRVNSLPWPRPNLLGILFSWVRSPTWSALVKCVCFWEITRCYIFFPFEFPPIHSF